MFYFFILAHGWPNKHLEWNGKKSEKKSFSDIFKSKKAVSNTHLRTHSALLSRYRGTVGTPSSSNPLCLDFCYNQHP